MFYKSIGSKRYKSQVGESSGALEHAPCIAFTSKDHGADAGDSASTLRAMGHSGSHANAGGQVAVAFHNRQDPDVSGDVTHPLGAKDNGLGLGPQMQVRRLTPRECERLQGFPDVRDVLRITVCADERIVTAQCAGLHSAPPSPDQSRPVAVHVLIDSERQEVRLHSLGRCLWTASIAGNESSSLLRMPSGDFARLIAGMRPMLERPTRAGRVALPPSISSSSAPSSGSASVLLSGREIAELAGDADKFTEAVSDCMKSTTSQRGLSIQNCGQTLRTLSCCVAVATTGCIPDSIRGASSYDLLVEVVTPYTLVPHRNKPAADGPRYKALGNSMAVPVMRWIGRQISAARTPR